MASYTPNYNLYKPAGTDQFDNFLTEFGNNMDIIDQNLGGGGSKHTILNESGTALADEPNLQFADGLKVTDDSGNNKTKVGVDTTFTEASTRANINSGDTFSTILGKIKKFFTDLKTVAFSGSYNDLSDKPTIPDISTKVSKSGDNMTGNLTMKGKDVILGTTGSGSNDSGDLVYNYGNGNEKVRIWTDDTYTQALNPNIRVNQSDGTVLRWSRLVSEDMLNTKYLSVFAGRSGANLMPWTADSDMQIDLTPTCDRVSADLNTAPIKNRAIFEEYNANSSNLPSANWHYVLTAQGSDMDYAGQLAMGMLGTQVFYRRKSGGSWFPWKSLTPRFYYDSKDISISALSPNSEVFDQTFAWNDPSYQVLGIVGYELSGNNYTRCFICKLSFGESGSNHYVYYSVRNSSSTDTTGALTLTVQLLVMAN